MEEVLHPSCLFLAVQACGGSVVVLVDSFVLRPVLQSVINIPWISVLTCPDIQDPDKLYSGAGYQLGNSTKGFLVLISACSRKKGAVCSILPINMGKLGICQHGGANSYSYEK